MRELKTDGNPQEYNNGCLFSSQEFKTVVEYTVSCVMLILGIVVGLILFRKIR